MNPSDPPAIFLEQARGELRSLAATGERKPGCRCFRKTNPVIHVVLHAGCPFHGRHTKLYQDAADDHGFMVELIGGKKIIDLRRALADEQTR